MSAPSTQPAVWLLLAAIAASPSHAAGQTPGPDAGVRAVRTTRPPVVDGHLDDEVWMLAPAASSFTQRDPDEGKAPTERTEIRFLYDNDALYIGARLHDSEPALVSRRLARRDDGTDADMLAVYLDPMHDHLTGAVFRVSASNVQQDAALHNDSWTDGSWDAVWDSAVSADDGGWSVEMRVPLSQLRFPFAEQHTWGVNVERYIQRRNERDWLLMVPKDESGLASRMPHLSGLDGIRPKRMFEVLPYTAARTEHIAPSRAGSPFNDGSRAFADAGVDVKWGLSSNLTLNGTINPDFGQVEVDPAVVNLTAFETFFDEKRPFFLEGSQIFGNFGFGGSNDFWGFNTSDPSIFYSRRIGRAPQLNASGDYVDPPSATTILGAAKLTGKTGGGWSLGLLEAVTDRETARTHVDGVRGDTAVEPFTNYFVARVQRELGRRVGAGFMATSVTRRLDTPSFRDALARQAFVSGVDGYVFLDSSRNWVLTGKVASSHVSGTAAYLQRLQRAPQRYYQRPDAAHVELDPGRTTLTGVSHRLLLNRNSGSWFVNAQIWGASPGFESNDLGFHSTGDRGGAHGVFFWRNPDPGRWLRHRQFWIAKWWTWNYARELQGDGLNVQGGLTFLNYLNLNGQGGWRARVLDDRLTRGGVSAEAPAGGFWNVNGGTDSRLPLSLSGSVNDNWNDAGGRSRNVNVSFSIKPASTVTISTGPSWNQTRNVAQYVRTVSDVAATDTHGERYVFGLLDQSQLTLTTRASWILSPKISLQLFMQPLLAAGSYSDFKELSAARTFDFLHYAAVADGLSYDAVGRRYTVDPDGSADAAASFSFADPDFNVKSLRLNAVFRWELRPGSAFYAVWTRQQQDLSNPGTFVPGRDASAMFRAPGDDVVLVKMAYWIGR